jgi:hypothetical protein
MAALKLATFKGGVDVGALVEAMNEEFRVRFIRSGSDVWETVEMPLGYNGLPVSGAAEVVGFVRGWMRHAGLTTGPDDVILYV